MILKEFVIELENRHISTSKTIMQKSLVGKLFTPLVFTLHSYLRNIGMNDKKTS